MVFEFIFSSVIFNIFISALYKEIVEIEGENTHVMCDRENI